jgi:hypothetical protein
VLVGWGSSAMGRFRSAAFAISSATCRSAASGVIFNGARLENFQSAFIVLVAFILFFFTGPLLVVAPRLIALRQAGPLRYGILASRYTQLFDMKWIESSQAPTSVFSGPKISNRRACWDTTMT